MRRDDWITKLYMEEIMNPVMYYLENGRVVYTPEYHINRGYCCGNGCRHCPFIPKHQKGNMTVQTKNVNNK